MAKYWQGSAGDYTIKSGDTLSGIARKFGVTVKDLAAWNNIPDVNKIRGGQMYTSNPNKPATPVAAAPAPAAPAAPAAKNVVTEINGVKTINENDIGNTGASAISTVPKATDKMQSEGVNYSWTTEGKVQGFLESQIKQQEARQQLLDSKSKTDYAGVRNAAEQEEYMNNQKQNKMGITGAAASDMDRMVSVANNARALELYSAEEMIDKGLDTSKRIAGMFGDLKARQVTVEEYTKRISEAQADANITGIYKDPIQTELLKQRDTANAVLNSPYSAPAEKARASKIANGVKNGFLELGLSDTGVETLQAIYNKESLRLQEEGNRIARSAVAATNRATAVAEKAQNAGLLEYYVDTHSDPKNFDVKAAVTLGTKAGLSKSQVTSILEARLNANATGGVTYKIQNNKVVTIKPPSEPIPFAGSSGFGGGGGGGGGW